VSSSPSQLSSARLSGHVKRDRSLYVIEVSDMLLATVDGPTLEHGIKGFAGKQISLPRRTEHRPSVDLLEERYSSFPRTGTR